MFNFTNPETFWLNVTNLALGIVTLICCVVLAAGFVAELIQRVRQRVNVPAMADDHAFLSPSLGITMADGGEREDADSKKSEEKK